MDLKCFSFQGLVQKEVGMLFVVCVWVCVCFLLFSWPLLAETQHIPSKDKFLSIWNFFVGHWTTTPALRHYTHTFMCLKIVCWPQLVTFCPLTFLKAVESIWVAHGLWKLQRSHGWDKKHVCVCSRVFVCLMLWGLMFTQWHCKDLYEVKTEFP